MLNCMSVTCARQPRWFRSDVAGKMMSHEEAEARDGAAAAAASQRKNVYTAELLG
jgi:hypothetical protein